MTDRELDALIAERIMGLEIVDRAWPCGYAPDCGTYEAALDLDPQNGLWEVAPDAVYKASEPLEERRIDLGFWCKPVPPYSTDIAQAWEVAMVYIRAGCAAWIEGDGHTGYRAGCTSGQGRFEAHSDNSPARAMCLAALKERGVEVEP